MLPIIFGMPFTFWLRDRRVFLNLLKQKRIFENWAAQAFIDPILAHETGTWNPDEWSWC